MGRQICLMLLVLMLVGCTLTVAEDETPDELQVVDGNADTAPTVRIISPASGDRVPVNQPVDIIIETDALATRLLLNVDGRVTTTKGLPADQSGPAQAILNWQPTSEGTYSIEVIAYNQQLASAPSAIQLEVSGTAAVSSDDPTTCTGRVLVSELNYREGPGRNSRKMGRFDMGETVTIVGRNADTTWYKTQRSNSDQVWVINNKQWLQVDGMCSTVPIME